MELVGTAFLAPSLTVSPVAPAVSQAAIAPAVPSISSSSALATCVAAAGVLAAAGRKSQRAGRTARRFFNSAPPKPQRVPGPLAIPGLPEPSYRNLDDELLREMDAGFDPLNVAMQPSPWGQGEDAYYNYREAEIKHGRLAMLATVGWLTSEELQASLASKLGLPDDLAAGDLAPSLVNGGLGNLPVWFLPGVAFITGLIEVLPSARGDRVDSLKYKPRRGRAPGDLNFDPLDLQGKLTTSGYSFVQLHNAEVKHGRAAMIAITAFVVQEFVSKVPIIAEDEISADRVVAVIDKSIEAVDKAAGLKIPDIPLPFTDI